MKRAVLVNGIPASGKSTVARGIAERLRCPLMTLDTVKDPLFEHFGIGDREHNRKLGRASYAVIFNAIGDWPDASCVVIDAWFGFQPPEVLDRLTSLIPMRRLGQPHELAALVSWLASDECSFSSGACYDISGGRATY